MFKIFDKWRIKRLDRKIDRLLLKSDDKIGKKYRHEAFKLSLFSLLLTALTILIPIIGIIVVIVAGFGKSVFTSPKIMTSAIIVVISIVVGILYALNEFNIINSCWNAWYNVITSHFDPIPTAMKRWRYWPHYDIDIDRMINICYDSFFKENVGKLFKNSELLTDAEYGRLVKPILAYIKVCLTIDDGNDAELREEFIRKTDLEQFLHEMMECKAAREMKLDELKNEQDRAIKDNALGKIDVVTKTIGMNKPPKEVSESVEIRRLNDVNAKLKDKINELEAKVVRST